MYAGRQRGIHEIYRKTVKREPFSLSGEKGFCYISRGREGAAGRGRTPVLRELRFQSTRNSKFPVLLLKAFRKSVNSPGGSDSTDFLNNAEAQETNCF